MYSSPIYILPTHGITYKRASVFIRYTICGLPHHNLPYTHLSSTLPYLIPTALPVYQPTILIYVIPSSAYFPPTILPLNILKTTELKSFVDTWGCPKYFSSS